jgi:hypothetical protein
MKGGGGPRFPHKALARIRAISEKVRMDNLERDLSLERNILRPVGNSHRAPPEDEWRALVISLDPISA